MSITHIPFGLFYYYYYYFYYYFGLCVSVEHYFDSIKKPMVFTNTTNILPT